MSSSTAALIVLLLQAAVLIPAFVGLKVRALGWPVLFFYSAGFMALIIYYGSLGRVSIPPPSRELNEKVDLAPASDSCSQIIRLSEQAMLIRNRTDAAVTVNAAAWKQIPEQARLAITACLQGPTGSPPVQIIEQE